jgi:hypothetical protein
MFTQQQSKITYFLPNSNTPRTFSFVGETITLAEFLASPGVDASKLSKATAFYVSTTQLDSDGASLNGEAVANGVFRAGESIRFQINMKGNNMSVFPANLTLAALMEGGLKPTITGENVMTYVEAIVAEQAAKDKVVEANLETAKNRLAKAEKNAGISARIAELNRQKEVAIASVRRQQVENGVSTQAQLVSGLKEGNYEDIIRGLQSSGALTSDPSMDASVITIEATIEALRANAAEALTPYKAEVERLEAALALSRSEQKSLLDAATAFVG